MNKLLRDLLLAVTLLTVLQSCKKDNDEVIPESETFNLSVMQFNIWNEGKNVTNGFELQLDEIAKYDPDFVTISEVNNLDNTFFFEKAVAGLAKRGKKYYSFYSGDPGLLSKYPIKEYSKDGEISGMNKLIAVVEGQEIAIYTAHLDYTHYAVYYPRGYNGNTWKELSAPVTDLKTIMADDAQSKRPKSINDFLQAAKKDINLGRIVVLGGDFNEASHLDWTEATKNSYDHNGVVAPWRASTSLYNNGFKDSYRVIYPNEVDYPGFTWPAQATWAPKADERDRIDFIYYYANDIIKPKESFIIGPKETIVKNVAVAETSKDIIKLPIGVWPTDHKVLMTVFEVKKPSKSLFKN
ncbi:endonuclease/exonuclease/phosphatase family protein [Pedobacter nototheniae]|uniref:endonuclease/exonuclease/phosphatase family protein n=1 Tax=Pedobacter nototheniae TaxID=2488994 RepID=UPI00103F5B89|nr:MULTISPECIES: endonuclease/exonuclease/phosphatase family protein [Pedobacter]